ncbi:MAG: hypothetical protein NWP35_04665, partial [Ilumatobacteraceae bacterium]|nr:hypothetical protein [Ilumatobacteraceae bacterium]
APENMPMWKHVQRIEQVSDRVVITAGHVIHDFPHVDGTFENGCHDVLEMDLKTPMVVSATYEDGVLVLRPQGIPGIEVKRWRDGEFLMWEYHGAFSMKLERII